MRRAGTGVVADRPVFSTFNLNSALTDCVAVDRCALERARREEATLSLLDHSFGDG